MLRWCLGVPLVVGSLFYAYNTLSIEETKSVETIYGPVVGEQVDGGAVKFMAFKGIPYAKAPRGELRFRAPEPPDQWDTTKKATQFGPICPQAAKAPGTTHDELGRKVCHLLQHAQNVAKVAMQLLRQSEDCLTLNVYTTQVEEAALRPVLVWFHGGGFYSGDGTDALYGPEYLVREDIVVVTANYRLGPLGFLSTNTSDASGNWGLKDQVAVLKWVRDNIANFGGDPKQVTIYGESAGGASVHYHVLSPLSKGLFQKAIMSSGAATSDWALTDQQERLSRNLARLTGASQEDIADPSRRVEHLREVDVKTLMSFMWRSMEETIPWEQDLSINTKGFIPFVPVIEPPGTPGAFLTEDPKVIMSEGRFNRVPLMMGFNDLDGAVLFIGPTNYSTPKQLENEKIDVCLYLPNEIRSAVEEKRACPEVARAISNMYFDGQDSSTSPLGFVKFFGDRSIIHYIYASQKWFARYPGFYNPTFFYYFKYDGEWNLVKDLYSIDLPGVTHWDELIYVFKQNVKSLPHMSAKSPGYVTHRRMINFINNFVRYGTPTPFKTSRFIPWNKVNRTHHNTMIIDSDLKIETELLKERMDFWDNLYMTYTGNSYYQYRN